MAETTNQTSKLYGFDTWHLEKITEYDVVKETEKTYVVAKAGKPSFNGRRHTNTVRKSEMSFYDTRLATSYAGAVEILKEYLRKRIASNNDKAKTLIADSDECAALLKKYEEGGEND